MTEHRALVRTAALLGTAALALTACTGRSGSAGPEHAVPRDTGAPTASAAWRDPADTVRENATRLLADTGRHTGTGASLPLPATASGTQVVAIECRGHGDLTVVAGHAGTYRLPCSGAGNGDEMETYDSRTPVPAGTLRIAPVPGITWQVAVGWSAASTRPTRTPGAHASTGYTPYPTRRPTRTAAPHTTAPDPGDGDTEPEPTHTTAHHTPPPVHHTSAPRPKRPH